MIDSNPFSPLEPGWHALLHDEIGQPGMQQLCDFLDARANAGFTIYPDVGERFNAFNSTPFEQVKVVILGQDPYHGPGQAHGLCFSVRQGVPFPPSLRNIFEELKRDLAIPPPSHGCLQSWAEQGVLLLNAVLTVESGQAAAHAGRGWEWFTDHVVQKLGEQRENLVFLLWGAYAQKKGAMIDRNRHCVLETAHPSPLSAHRGFVGCGHFSKTNRYLVEHGQVPIDWAIT
jgi:uracil-DNA glycosylase